MGTMRQVADPFGSTRPPPQTSFRGSVVVVIDDDDDMRDLLCHKLERAGYSANGFSGARQALDAMDAGLVPDLILFDLLMPGMSGWEFRVEQKRRASLAQVPAVAVSGDASPYAAAIDASAHITKPVEIGQLCDVIDRLLSAAERKQRALRSMEADRARALGMLVASVAHEINNPLTYVSGNVELALQELAQKSEQSTPAGNDALRPLLEAARDGAQRVGFIVQLLCTFVHSDEHDVRLVDPLRALDAATRLAMHYIRPRARLVFMPGLTELVRANEARLAQIFLNLLVNAAQSIPEGEPSAHEVRVRTDMRDGMVSIEVSDTGAGISRELQSTIFEPVFTLDPTIGSAGLSLAITRDMVERMGGKLSLVTAERGGTTLRIELPAVDQRKPATSASQTAALRVRLPSEAEPRVLVIDDEPLVGRLVEAALSGHHVEVVTDPAEGVLRLAHGEYDVVLCDLKMPEITGIEVYAHIEAKRPELCSRFVLMTGAAADAEVEQFVERSNVPVLRKPFAIQDLRNMVQRFAAASAE